MFRKDDNQVGGADIYVLIGCSIVEQAPLPLGWEMRCTNDGHEFFADHNTRSITFKGESLYIALRVMLLTVSSVCRSSAKVRM